MFGIMARALLPMRTLNLQNGNTTMLTAINSSKTRTDPYFNHIVEFEFYYVTAKDPDFD